MYNYIIYTLLFKNIGWNEKHALSVFFFQIPIVDVEFPFEPEGNKLHNLVGLYFSKPI